MQFDTDDIVSVTEASQSLSKLVKSVSEGQRRYLVMRNNRPAAVLADVGSVERIERLDEAEEDLRLLGIALVRMMTDSGERHSLDEVAAEFGVDLDED